MQDFARCIIALLCASSVYAVPAGPINRQSNYNGFLTLNTENSTELGHPPAGFDVDVKEHTHDIPLNPLGMWLNAINAVYQVSATDMHRTWDMQTFSLPRYGVDVILNSIAEKETDPPTLQTRFVIWTIQHVMYTAWNDRLYKPIAGIAKWHDVQVGLVQIWKKQPAPVDDAGCITNSTNSLVLPANESSNAVESTFAADRGLTWAFNYRASASPLDSSGIFLATLEGLGEAAEEGLSSRCEHFFTIGYSVVTFELRSKRDPQGNPLLRYGHVREVMQRSIYHLVSQRRFAELDVTISLNGQEIAHGGWERLRAASTINGTSEQ